MALTVACYYIAGRHRSMHIARAMARGIKTAGDIPVLRDEKDFAGVDTDAAVFYGLEGNTPKIFREYRRVSKAVYVDLGYWGRKTPECKWDGYHKISINDRHPTAYFQARKHAPDRAKVFGLTTSAWRVSGGRFPMDHKYIVLAGMGDKAAAAEGFDAEEWERWAIEKIRAVTKRIIIYRPKPSWKMARPIVGKSILYHDPRQPLEPLLRQSHAVVTHHSNVAVDGLLLGIPCFVQKGVALPMASSDLRSIEEPVLPEEREQWLNDVAYCQWNVAEMRDGLAWRHLKEEGLV
jgi:hypothetical protein